ncbi:MFS transporter [Novosphingobium sp. PY1]|uniref:MFS transporter n=1 Tax=Novosphingobium sp. PY1 TaxID=1882221 RepID=UPI001A8F797F|nr:MFS transporter [Novosphingobium sp. PY1]
MDGINTGTRRAMALRGFLCQNVVVGAAFGAFGITVLPVQAHFGVGRGMATFGLALAVLVMGVGAPLAAGVIGRFGLRVAILAGVILSGLGYLLLGLAPLLGEAGMGLVLFAYALPIGLGLAFVPFSSAMLASRWFQPNPGPALGFVSMPVLVALLPVAGTPVIAALGLSSFYFLLAGLHLLLLPLALGIGEPLAGVSGLGHDDTPALAMRTIFRRPAFWVLVCGAGTLTSVGITGMTHLVAFGVERGLSDQHAALLVTFTGGASVAGSLVVGMLCGWLGAARTLALIGVLTALGWSALLATSDLPVMVSVVLLIGAGGAGVFPAVNVLAGQVFGLAALHRVIGLYAIANLPFTFALPPLSGVLHDVAGGYAPVAGMLIAASFAVSMLFFAFSLASGRPLAVAEPA